MYPTRPHVSGSSAPPNRRRLCRAFFATPRFLPRSRVRKTTRRSDSPSVYVLRIRASVVYSGIPEGGRQLYYSRLTAVAVHADVVQHAIVVSPVRLDLHVKV